MIGSILKFNLQGRIEAGQYPFRWIPEGTLRLRGFNMRSAPASRKTSSSDQYLQRLARLVHLSTAADGIEFPLPGFLTSPPEVPCEFDE